MIRGHRSLRLVVLNACEGARSARDDPFGGVAQALVRQGIPAVIAMQFEISDPAALVFSQSFYQAIADGLPVDVAMVEARMAMFAEGHEVEWATPVLYLRSPDGRVFTRARSRTPSGRPARTPTGRPGEDADRQAREDGRAAGPEDADRQAREDADRQRQDCAPHRLRSRSRLHAWPAPSQATPTWSTVWRSARTGGCSPPPAGDQTARVWDAATGEHRRTLTGHTGAVVSVAFSPDGRLLATASHDKTARLWDPATGDGRRTLNGHTDDVYGVAFSPDGTLLATASSDGTARLWDPATGDCLRTPPATPARSTVWRSARTGGCSPQPT